MRRFAALYAELDSSTATSAKLEALLRYYAEAPAADAAWATYFLAGGRPRQAVPTALLRELACERAGIDDWLFEECYQAVGDLAETLALMLPPPARASDEPLALWVERRLLPLRGLSPAEQRARLHAMLDELDTAGRFLLLKLIGGSFRVGVSRLLVQRALAQHAGLDAKRVAERMMGYVDAGTVPVPARFAALIAPHDDAPRGGQPYPFFLAHPIDPQLADFEAALGPASQWLAEWKYDGIRAQLVRRGGQGWLWSRGEELITERFPELHALSRALPDGTVLDGEIVVLREGDERPAPFALLQQRIGRKALTKKVLADAPGAFVAYDMLEAQGIDVRGEPQHARRERLERLAASLPAGVLRLSPLLDAADWPTLAAQRAGARERGVEGLMLKHRDAAYGIGRTKAGGVWWKWKIDPMSVDAVLIYAQAGHGRRASLYSDYTFAVWNRAPRDAVEAAAAIDAIAERRAPAPDALQLVPFAKAFSGLTDDELRRIDRAIRTTTIEKFGPVRSVRPSLVFELGFEGIARSARHKSGIAVRFPRMLRIRDDKPLHEADSLAQLEALLSSA